MWVRSDLTIMCTSAEYSALTVIAVLGMLFILLPPLIMLRVLYVAINGMADDVTALLSNEPVGTQPAVSVKRDIEVPSIRYKGVAYDVRWVEGHISPAVNHVTADVQVHEVVLSNGSRFHKSPACLRYDANLRNWTNNFNEGAWFFEVFRLIRKALFVAIAIVLNEAHSQAFAAIVLMSSSLMLTAFTRPYKRPFGWIDINDCCGQLVIIVAVLVGMTWCGPDSDPSTNVGASVALLSLLSGWAVAIVTTLGMTAGCCAEEKEANLMPPPTNADIVEVGDLFNVLYTDSTEEILSSLAAFTGPLRKLNIPRANSDDRIEMSGDRSAEENHTERELEALGQHWECNHNVARSTASTLLVIDC